MKRLVYALSEFYKTNRIGAFAFRLEEIDACRQAITDAGAGVVTYLSTRYIVEGELLLLMPGEGGK